MSAKRLQHYMDVQTSFRNESQYGKFFTEQTNHQAQLSPSQLSVLKTRQKAYFSARQRYYANKDDSQRDALATELFKQIEAFETTKKDLNLPQPESFGLKNPMHYKTEVSEDSPSQNYAAPAA